MNHCNICGTHLGDPVFVSDSTMALTSLCELRYGRVKVWSCPQCSHLMGVTLPDTEKYYESDYRILLDHDDEDQIYEVREEKIVYRTDHQVDILLEKLDLPRGALLLDYGCAKASTPRRLLASRSDIQAHLFDVSEMYQSHWDHFVSHERRAIHRTPENWQGKFDVVTSFFALEHIPAPQDTVRHIADLLANDGTFYGIVPDTFGNVADFIVIDHVNHFTIPSLYTLLAGSGFGQIDIDANAHRGALVFTARKNGAPGNQPDVEETIRQSKGLSAYWSRIGERIRISERAMGTGSAAIYGSGFYGAHIFSSLLDPGRIECFLDRSPYQQEKTLFGKPIMAPDRLPAHITTLFVGLNPAIARETMTNMHWPDNQNLKLVFLDQDIA